MASEPLPLTRVWGQRKMVVLALIGFASGLPYYLTKDTLQAWMRVEQVDLTTIGLFGAVGLPYSLKFLWAPFMDRFVPPFLGRRRGWLVVTQVLLLIAIAAMAIQDPRRSLWFLALNAIFIAFFSASQDIVADAYRTDSLSEREMGAGAALFVVGYRVALITTGALALMLADRMSWPAVYAAISVLMLVGIAAAVMAPEPANPEAPPSTFAAAVVQPFAEFFSRAGVARGMLVLGFILLYKLPDAFAQAMATPFLLDLTFTLSEIGAIKGGLGIAATIVGVIAGGSLVARMGINRSLWIFGVLQAVSNLAYYILALGGKQFPLLVTTILVENFCTGLVTAGFVAFLMSLCSVRFSATQYALLSSIPSIGRDGLAVAAGKMAEVTGWPRFFLVTLVIGIPGMLLLPLFAPWNRDGPLVAARHTGDTMEPAP